MGCSPVAFEDLLWVIGPPLRTSFSILLGADGDLEEGVRLYRQRYADRGLFEAAPYAGIEEALAALQARTPLILCTSKLTMFATRVIEHFGLAGYFEDLRGSELDGRFDDKADLIADILRGRRLAPDAVCMIGDRKHDIMAARANCAASVGALWGYGGLEELVGAGATVTCGSPEDLPQAVATLGRA
jgi:phosphoglycolate phosphatase